MKYFEVNSQYYALIKAETIEETMEMYVEYVCDDDDGDLIDNIKEVSQLYAQKVFIDAEHEDLFTSMEDKIKEFDTRVNGVLVIDGSFM